MADAPPPPKFKPPSPTPPSMSPTSYRSARQNELDALRSKGLAKIFNRHFTDATEKITSEREAADAALAEIVARKAELAANPKLFDKNGLTFTQLDALHMELQKRKHTVQRKERETIELYRRYVSQYGGNEVMARKALSKHGTPNSTALGNISMGSTMPVLHENHDYDIIRQNDLDTARAKEKKKCVGVGKQVGRKLEDGSFYESTRAPSPTNTNRVGKLIKKEITSQSPPLLDITGDLNSNGGMDAPGVVASTGSSTTLQPQDKQSQGNDVSEFPPISPSNSFGNISGLDSSFLGGVMVGPGNKDDYDSDGDGSDMSGLTSIDGATIAIAEFKLTEFLREETESIRKMLGGDVGGSDYDEELSDIATVKTATSIESQRAANAANKAEELAKKMAEATAWMDNPALLDDDSEDDNDENDGEESLQPTPQWVAYYSDEHKRVYYFNTLTNQTCWTEPQDEEIDKSALKKEKSKLGNDDDYDEDTVVVKDYTKAEPKERSQNRSMSENLALIDQFRPNSDAASVCSGAMSGAMSRNSRTSKVLAFKRKRALKRRRRNRIIVAFTVCSMVGAGVYRSREQWMPVLGLQTTQQKEIENDRILKEAAASAAEKVKAERLQKEKLLAAEKERKMAELAASKKAELEAKKKTELEAKEKAELAAKKKAEEKRIQAELVAQKKAEEKRRLAELAAQKKIEEEIKAEKAAKKKAEIAAKKKVEEERRKAELAAKMAEEERVKAELVAKAKAELAAKKKAEEERIKAELAAKAKAELAAKKKAEEERKVAELAAAKKVEEERRLAELRAAEERKLAEFKAAEERKLAEMKAEDERKLAELKAKEEKREKQEAEQKRREKELERQIREDERKKVELEQRIREDERKKLLDEIRRKNEETGGLTTTPIKRKKKIICSLPFAFLFSKDCKKVKKEKKEKVALVKRNKPDLSKISLIDSMLQ